MAEEIVSCPGCGKKFRIPDGAAPSGSFPCTACETDVRYGSKPKTGGDGGPSSRRGGRRRRRGRAGAAARGRSARAKGAWH